nr:MAG TPA: Cytochrome b [Bacteriophage sp.]
MVKVIYEGKPTTFRAICSNCHSLLEFTKEDFIDSYGKKNN